MNAVDDIKNQIKDTKKMNAQYAGYTGQTQVAENESETAEPFSPQRDKVIIRTSIIGILANVFLASFKASVGLLSHSIAVVLDAVNNLSDAASSLITIVGTRLASKAPDKKHPFGHGRVEYLTAMVIAVLVLYAGISSFTASVEKIIHPEAPDYGTAALIIIAVAVLVKIILGRYVKGIGEKVNSDSLINSGQDASLDAVISASTLAAAVIYLTTGLSLEAWLGAVISIIISKAGGDMLRETYSKILGERADAELARGIKKTLLSFENVSGAYDLVLNNYGPDNFIGSVHIEIPDYYTAAQIDELVREMTYAIYREHRVIMTAIGIYSVNTRDSNIVRMRKQIAKEILQDEYILQMHGFYVDEVHKTLRFDVVVSFDAPDRRKVHKEVCAKVHDMYPDYSASIALDTDFSE